MRHVAIALLLLTAACFPPPAPTEHEIVSIESVTAAQQPGYLWMVKLTRRFVGAEQVGAPVQSLWLCRASTDELACYRPPIRDVTALPSDAVDPARPDQANDAEVPRGEVVDPFKK